MVSINVQDLISLHHCFLLESSAVLVHRMEPGPGGAQPQFPHFYLGQSVPRSSFQRGLLPDAEVLSASHQEVLMLSDGPII